MNKNLTMKMGNCPHRKYGPHLVELVRTGAIDPVAISTGTEPLSVVVSAYEAFDRREPGWIKVELKRQNSRFALRYHRQPHLVARGRAERIGGEQVLGEVARALADRANRRLQGGAS